MGKKALVGAACVEVVQDPEANLQQLADIIREAGRQGISLLVMPECAVQGYPEDLAPGNVEQFEYFLRTAEVVPGEATAFLAKVADEAGVEVAVGLTEKLAVGQNAGKLHNTAVVLRKGEVTARYRKVHTGAWEKMLWNRGEEFVLTESAIGHAGLMICYDMTFPETARELALAGAETLLVPTAWPSNSDAASTIVRGYELFTRARALENQVFLVCSNLVGGPGEGFYGHSRVVGPTGEILAESVGAGIAAAEIDVADGLVEARAGSYYGMVFLRDREEAVYGSLLGSTATPESDHALAEPH